MSLERLTELPNTDTGDERQRTNKPRPCRAKRRQRQPGVETKMLPQPQSEAQRYRAAGQARGQGRRSITGGDSGIGKSVAIHFAKEGADVAILYLEEHEDAARTASLVEAEGRRCLLIAGDVGDREFCASAVEPDARRVRPPRHSRQQRGRAAYREGFCRHCARAVRADLPHQRLRDVSPHARRPCRICARGRPSSTRPRSPRFAAARVLSTTPRPKAPSSRSRARSRFNSPRRAFASTLLRPARSGRRLFPRVSIRKGSPLSAPTPR